MQLNIEEPRKQQNISGFALFALGFRPFFLLAGIAALLLLLIWLLQLWGMATNQGYYQGSNWHAHEMLFGYIAAVVAGFLLTAVRNWTNIQTLMHTPLALLAGLWLLGRILPFFSNVIPHPLIAVVDVSFLPALAIAIAKPLLKSKQKNNAIFPILLLVMAVANLLTHLEFLGVRSAGANIGINFMIYMIIILIMVMGGRVIPFFTERGIVGAQTKSWRFIEILSLLSFIVVALVDLLLPNHIVMLPLALFAATAQAIRLYGWYDKRIWRVPMLWILQLGYAWVVVGLVMLALSPLALVAREFALHALTVGGMGLITLGMMARVALGHSGRSIEAGLVIKAAFIFIAAAAVVRVLLPIIAPQSYLIWLGVSGTLWCMAFVMFVMIYAPILIRPRIDGRPG